MSEATDRDFLQPFEESPIPRFTVTDDSTAEWCLRKIKEAKADQEKWRQHYAEQMKKVEEATAQTVGYFEGLLEAYFEQVPHKATKTQESYALPGGKLVRKKQQPKSKNRKKRPVSPIPGIWKNRPFP